MIAARKDTCAGKNKNLRGSYRNPISATFAEERERKSQEGKSVLDAVTYDPRKCSWYTISQTGSRVAATDRIQRPDFIQFRIFLHVQIIRNQNNIKHSIFLMHYTFCNFIHFFHFYFFIHDTSLLKQIYEFSKALIGIFIHFRVKSFKNISLVNFTKKLINFRSRFWKLFFFQFIWKVIWNTITGKLLKIPDNGFKNSRICNSE